MNFSIITISIIILLNTITTNAQRNGTLLELEGCEVISPNHPSICCKTIAPVDDNPADECVFGSTGKSFNVTGICNENFDCCTCTKITVYEARSFTCGGDQACIGVPLEIFGSPLGCVLNCNGDLSCLKSTLIASNLIGLKCDGDSGCQETEMLLNQDFDININPLLPGLQLPFNGDYSGFGSIIKAKNILALLCNGDNSCQECDFDFECVGLGCPINCGGDVSCKDTYMNVKNANLIEFVGDNAFENGTIDADCITTGCPVRCSAEQPCVDSIFNVVNSIGVLCSGISDSCVNAKFTLLANLGGFIHCFGTNSCKGAIFNGGFDNLGNKLLVANVKEVTCSGSGSCQNTDIFADGDEETGCVVSCTGDNACSNNVDENETGNENGNAEDRAITLPNGDADDMDDAKLEVTNVKSFRCGGNQFSPACNGTIYIYPFDNTFTTICAGENSCNSGNLNFEFGELNELIESFSCAGKHACLNTKINFFVLNLNKFIIKTIGFSGLNSFLNGNLLIETNDNTDLEISDLRCTGQNGCEDSNVEVYTKNLKLAQMCSGGSSCKNMKIFITVQTFEIDIRCTNLNSCDNAFVIDVLNDNQQIPFIAFDLLNPDNDRPFAGRTAPIVPIPSPGV